ncbi:MAG: phage holin family protein [Succinivibrio sp.]|nr:phage holin family protein [Succinivibrio sp.]
MDSWLDSLSHYGWAALAGLTSFVSAALRIANEKRTFREGFCECLSCMFIGGTASLMAIAAMPSTVPVEAAPFLGSAIGWVGTETLKGVFLSFLRSRARGNRDPYGYGYRNDDIDTPSATGPLDPDPEPEDQQR